MNIKVNKKVTAFQSLMRYFIFRTMGDISESESKLGIFIGETNEDSLIRKNLVFKVGVEKYLKNSLKNSEGLKNMAIFFENNGLRDAKNTLWLFYNPVALVFLSILLEKGSFRDVPFGLTLTKEESIEALNELNNYSLVQVNGNQKSVTFFETFNALNLYQFLVYGVDWLISEGVAVNLDLEQFDVWFFKNIDFVADIVESFLVESITQKQIEKICLDFKFME